MAANQIVLSQRAGLNPWKGGGFGMFATADRGSLRQLQVYRVDRDGDVRLSLPDEVEVQRRAAQELPQDRNLRALAEALAADAKGRKTLRVEVWRARFDLERRQWRREKLREGSYSVGMSVGSSAAEEGGAGRRGGDGGLR
ncbi:MAG: hypothetical protein VCB42_10285 [Myxococcota bacterium]